jgi:nitrate/nitrite-specific signal transduction histidine kinase
MVTFRSLQIFTVLLPTCLIGGFEFIRHQYLLSFMSMETGNILITVLTFVLSFFFSAWVFRTIRKINDRLVAEQARRAVYEERERLARELHDGIAQSLFFLNVKLKQGKFEEARKSVVEIDKHVRQAIFNLRSLPDESISLTKRLETWISEWSAFSGVEVAQSIDVPDGLFQPSEEVQLFAIVQEAFSNIQKHAHATRVDVSFTLQADGKWNLCISDNGVGIGDQPEGFSKYGLVMMRERAGQLGATLEIRNRVTGGTEILLIGQGGKRV